MTTFRDVLNGPAFAVEVGEFEYLTRVMEEASVFSGPETVVTHHLRRRYVDENGQCRDAIIMEYSTPEVIAGFLRLVWLGRCAAAGLDSLEFYPGGTGLEGVKADLEEFYENPQVRYMDGHFGIHVEVDYTDNPGPVLYAHNLSPFLAQFIRRVLSPGGASFDWLDDEVLYAEGVV